MEVRSLRIRNQVLSDQVKRRADELSAVAAVAASISQSLDLDVTLQTALTAVLDVTGAQAGGISLIDYEAGEVVLRAQRGWLRDFVHENPMRIPLGRGMSGRVIATDSVLVNNHLDITEPLAVPSFHDEQFRSIAMAPMHARGAVVGIVSIMSLAPESFDDDHISVLRSVADTVGVALDNARLYERSQEDQRRLNAVLQASADGIIATDQAGLIRMVNSAAERLLGIRAADVLEQPLTGARLGDPILSALRFALDAPAESGTRTFRASTADGRVLSILVSPVAVERQVDAGASGAGWVIVLQDMTLLATMEQARAAFIRSAAHDMRNPLTAALNAMTLLPHYLPDPGPNAIEVIDIANQSIGRLQALIDDLLSIEQIQSHYEVEMAAVDLGELIFEVGAGARQRLADSGLHLELESPSEPLVVLIDRRWFVRAVENYLDNAVRHAPAGSTIRLALFRRDNRLHIEVSDEGEGIAPAAQARLFERFYSVSPGQARAGAGLGLAMVKSIAEAHGGDVYVHSTPGSGSTFGMIIPLRLADGQSTMY